MGALPKPAAGAKAGAREPAPAEHGTFQNPAGGASDGATDATTQHAAHPSPATSVRSPARLRSLSLKSRR